jgi:addiction module HigA family antidote
MRTPHPGEELWNDWIEPLNITVGDAAAALGVARKTLSAIINGRQAITPEMSVRLAKALGTAPDTWALKQLAFDVASVDRRRLAPVKRITPEPTR